MATRCTNSLTLIYLSYLTYICRHFSYRCCGSESCRSRPRCAVHARMRSMVVRPRMGMCKTVHKYERPAGQNRCTRRHTYPHHQHCISMPHTHAACKWRKLASKPVLAKRTPRANGGGTREHSKIVSRPRGCQHPQSPPHSPAHLHRQRQTTAARSGCKACRYNASARTGLRTGSRLQQLLQRVATRMQRKKAVGYASGDPCPTPSHPIASLFSKRRLLVLPIRTGIIASISTSNGEICIYSC